ncbi:hypothetical protein [Dactylosporangium matsuzakiense]|uniref:Trigger factor n=1 Tax=Dactylosporangium matsuzakiense TaxID=53360 RepID=A0A9W6NRD0_9ACTN|nr:hypothetical protein [Dactylosporangium matsuzakiense]UWZ48454.1 hypothetical protein Dmats_19800 [Dactylosporangium matsuzakiense]GLL06283.1 trigger factor [Dactylosporangium matsuzakiense]
MDLAVEVPPAQIPAALRGLAPFALRLPAEGDEPRPLPPAAETALLDLVEGAAARAGVRPLGRADVAGTSTGGGSLRVTARVELRPPIALPPLDAVTVSLAELPADPPDADAVLELLRGRFATLSDVDRPAARGDVVRFAIAVDGASRPAPVLRYAIGSATLLAGGVAAAPDLVAALDEALPGLRAGDTARLEAAGVRLTVTVHGVQERHRPPLDDAFAGLVDAFETIDDLRDTLRHRHEHATRAVRRYAVREAVLDTLLAAAPVAAPPALVADEVARRRRWMTARLLQEGTSLEAYLKAAGRTAEDVDTEIRTAAVERIRRQLLLDAVAAAAGITEPDDDRRRSQALRAAVSAVRLTGPGGERLDLPALVGAAPGSVQPAPAPHEQEREPA